VVKARVGRGEIEKGARMSGWTLEVFSNDCSTREWKHEGGGGVGTEGRRGNDGRYADVLMTRTESHRQTAG